MHAAFFYGSLMHPKVLHAVIARSGMSGAHMDRCSNHLSMQGYRRHPVHHADYPACIRGQAEDMVVGVLVRGLTDEHLCLLDIFEGDVSR
ncbi:hypothetical protein SYNPS1DRAFT_11937 [Syncephalis pseudoplumigaleata]|uniref:Putative gamma-glutamylcyclotransferase n=1 Tax=Syncephalis pseudoplumigaleata TaxID=1712513 RepID=A0A4P9Z6X3_9FUNG|nr:hypothetical protein SYNPS1DRAFT_11937 [Syncephalis pseudoplumigaleata]|eukprot:RKP27932.1 hypothetical protein SYNPS1DRAFT_11937 [Syncephalis pseudoplumigaleata]